MPATVTINAQSTAADCGTTLFAAAGRLGVAIPSSCRQQGKCRECLVEITHGMEFLSPPVEEERHLKEGFRLSCRCAVASDTGAIRGQTHRRGAMQVEASGVAPTDRLPHGRPDAVVRREHGAVWFEDRSLGELAGPLLGIALDIGTTTVVVRLVDLENGALVATAAFENPQRFGGSDVMARIAFDGANPGRLLQRTLLGYLNRTLAEFAIDPATIYDYVVAGNPTMRDLFFGLDVQPIGQKPYRSTTESAWRSGQRPTTAVTVPAHTLRLPGHPEARVYGLPLVSGHVGGDAAACLLALAPHRGDELVAIMDLGTNTELFLGNRHRLLAASCPAGPAFEGRAISCGMPGLDGAIARVTLPDKEGAPRLGVIGGGTPAGICGSGLIDLLSEMLRTGRMNEFGRFTDGAEEITVAPEQAIMFSESDVNELAQAKGANVAGLRIVAQRYGRPLAELDRFYLAGGFGRHIDLPAARRIGLVPDLPDAKLVQVGNAAIEGATLALLSLTLRRELEALVQTVEHVELETDPQFFDHFVRGCQFRPLEATAEVGV